MIEKLFRFAVLALLLAILVFQVLAQRQGRYQFQSIGEAPVIFDSQTGSLLQYDSSFGVWRQVHPQDGEAPGPTLD
jgi:hypothetical protein